MTETAETFTKHGERLTPGRNVDRVDIGSGLELARRFGYNHPNDQMVVQYALRRHAGGEEYGAQRTALSGGIALTSWYAILAAATAGAHPKTTCLSVWITLACPACGDSHCQTFPLCDRMRELLDKGWSVVRIARSQS